MKKITTSILAGAFALASVNCTTSYDAYGNPRQTVNPGTAAAGVAAAGVLGYALSKDKKKNNNAARYARGDYRPDSRDRGYYDRRGNWRYY